MSVIIASKPFRGSKIKYPVKKGYLRVDVTSGSMLKLGDFYAKNLSPLFLGPIELETGEKVNKFENLWQYSKVYKHLNHIDDDGEPNKKWKLWREKGFNKLKNNKGIRTPVEVSRLKKLYKEGKIDNWTPEYSYYNNEKLDYLKSRKEIYIPQYVKLIKNENAFIVLKEKVKNGENIMIMDLDGPSLDIYPEGALVTEEFIKCMLNNIDRPFGHGYIIAAELLDINII